MANVIIKLTGVRELLRSDDVHDMLLEHGRAAMARLPAGGYSMTDHQGPKRWNVEVRATSKDAIADNMENNTLLKAVFGK